MTMDQPFLVGQIWESENYSVKIHGYISAVDTWEIHITPHGGYSWTQLMTYYEFLHYIHDHQLQLKNKDDQPKKPACIVHQYKEYVGFTERYAFCEKCDAKLDWDTWCEDPKWGRF